MLCCLALKESDPIGWASSQSQGPMSISSKSGGSGGSKAEDLEHQNPEEFGDYHFLESAVHEGLI